MVALINALAEGFTYPSDGSIYYHREKFDTASFQKST
jgi:hypothetical protein